jgi:uncharacterized protein
VERLLTPSKITAWLGCAHYLTMRHEVESGEREEPPRGTSAFARLLMDKGLVHETACLEAYEAAGLNVVRAPDKEKGESFGAWTQRVARVLDDPEADVLFQVPLVHDGIRGVADFLVRAGNTPDGRPRWEPVDAKLARAAAKPGHALQLCFYAEALTANGGDPADTLEVFLGSGDVEAIGYEGIRPYWARLRTRLAEVLATEPDAAGTDPEPCDHCQFCEFEATCTQTWRDQDSLVFVAGATKAERAALGAAGVTTLAELSTCAGPVEGLRDERLDRLRTQAALQVQARNQPDEKPPFQLIEPGDDATWGHGFDQLPAPDDGDVFLDFEGHPFWTPKRGLFFLFGFIARDDDGTWRFHELWAENEQQEAQRVEELVRYLAQRRIEHPNMHVYHYNHTERSSLEALTAEYQLAEALLAELVSTGLFVDLLGVARNAMQVGTESYGLKYLERLTDYERGHDIDKGAGAVVEFEEYMRDGDRTRLAAIAAYNEDDVRATQALRDWLIEQRPTDLPWRQAVLDTEDEHPDLDELLERLSGFDAGTPEHLLGDLLGYWLREWRAFLAPKLGSLSQEVDRQLDDPTVLADLTDPQEVEALTRTGRVAKWPSLRLRFPAQEIGRDLVRTTKFLYLTPEGYPAFAEIRDLDLEAGTVDLLWNARPQEIGWIPTSLIVDDWYAPKAKRTAFNDLVHQVLDPDVRGEPNPVTMSLLRADPPRFAPGGGPADGQFTDDLDSVTAWGAALDHGVLGIQGPPGTGKTFRGSLIAHRLIQQGKRVGIMAMSHHAIDNLLEGIVDAFAEHGGDVALNAIRKRDEPDSGGLPGVTYTGDNADLADPDRNLVAGTAWAFASPAVRGAPVDVLLIDEAGQLALIDAVVASMSAHNVIMLGDPLQLPQVTVASHPGGSGASALGHLLDDHATMPDDRGVFLSETRRMHPDVCRFISERIYEGELTSHERCTNLSTALGTGLRWLRADHNGCSTESPEEAQLLVDHIESVLGTAWTDHDGVEHVIESRHIMVVAPYNDQVRLLRDTLAVHPQLAGVSVGTVDKFQGREAPIVYFTMTSSSAQDMSRGPEFLFSRNRLNVAVSRAQCLAYLVCTDELLSSRAKTIEDMELIATLCAFVEYADRSPR